MAGVTGLEPATSGVTGRRSNQLSYTPVARAPRGGLILCLPRGVNPAMRRWRYVLGASKARREPRVRQ